MHSIAQTRNKQSLILFPIYHILNILFYTHVCRSVHTHIHECHALCMCVRVVLCIIFKAELPTVDEHAVDDLRVLGTIISPHPHNCRRRVTLRPLYK